MKMVFHRIRVRKTKGRSSVAFGIYAMMCLGTLALAGCGKQKPTDVAAQKVESSSSDQPLKNNPGPAAGAISPKAVPAVVVPEADASATLAKLTQVVRRFSVERRQVPQSLNEVAAAGYLAGVPAAPAGKQFAIDRKTLQVVLENH